MFFLFGGMRSVNILCVDLGYFGNKVFAKERFMV